MARESESIEPGARGPLGMIDEVAAATWKAYWLNRRSVAVPRLLSRMTFHGHDSRGPSAGQIIRQRRSAVSFDGKTSISSATFFQMLQSGHAALGAASIGSADALGCVAVGSGDSSDDVRASRGWADAGALCPGPGSREVAAASAVDEPELVWTQPPGCPEDLPLYWLLEGDAKKAAAQVSCHQEIAGDSAFSLGMIAEFEGRLREAGAWCYPRLFWEAGLLGQVLYLEAEAAGVRGTGIGCFFDDPVHEMLGVKGLSFQSLYHFTIGGPVEDGRLMTLPPYHHLNR